MASRTNARNNAKRKSVSAEVRGQTLSKNAKRKKKKQTPPVVASVLQTITLVGMATASPPATPSVNLCKKEAKRIGKTGMYRDRILQKVVTKSQVQRKDRLLIARANKRLQKLRSEAKTKYTAKNVSYLLPGFPTDACRYVQHSLIPNYLMQVFMLLQEKQFAECEWPLPPSAILMHVPLPEEPGKRTAEQKLRRLIWYSKSPLKNSSQRTFENGPRPQFTYVVDWVCACWCLW